MDLLGSSGGYWADLVPSTESSNLTSSADPVLGIGRKKLLPRLRITGQAGARAFRQTCGSSVGLIVPRRDVTLLGQLFMQRFPEVSVARCRIAPGVAYIAPTENLVHDGSSEGQRHADEHFTVLGHIRLR